MRSGHFHIEEVGMAAVVIHVVPQPVWIQKWVLADQEVTLFRRENELIYSVFRVGEVPVEGAVQDNAQLLQRIKRFDATIEEGIIHFRPIQTRIRDVLLQWEKPTGTLYLQRQGENVRWRWYAQRSRTVSYLPAESPLKYHFFMDHWMQYVSAVTLDNQLLSRVKIKPQMMRSRIQPSVLFHPIECAITLVCASSIGSNPSSWGGHAMIALEGWAGGSVFLKYAHLLSTREGAAIEIIEDRRVAICKQTETWKKPKHVGIQLMNRVGRDQQAIQQNQLNFNLLGNGRVMQLLSRWFGPNPHNCYSWAREALNAIGIRLPSHSNHLILVPRALVQEGVATHHAPA